MYAYKNWNPATSEEPKPIRPLPKEVPCPRCGKWYPLNDEHWHVDKPNATGFIISSCKKCDPEGKGFFRLKKSKADLISEGHKLEEIPVWFKIGQPVIVRYHAEGEDEQQMIRRRRGKVISINKRHFTVEVVAKKGVRNETFLIADLLTGMVKVRKDLEADESGTN